MLAARTLYTGVGRVVSGDLVVHDALAVPTARDQCKNDGWRQFGSMFTNQGQCVAYVSAEQRPPANPNEVAGCQTGA